MAEKRWLVNLTFNQPPHISHVYSTFDDAINAMCLNTFNATKNTLLYLPDDRRHAYVLAIVKHATYGCPAYVLANVNLPSINFPAHVVMRCMYSALTISVQKKTGVTIYRMTA